MPELPEVETTCNGIKPYIVGQLITDIIIRQPKLRWEVPDALKKDILYNKNNKKVKILSVIRRAKYIIITTPVGYIIIHLGMSGKLCVYDPNKKVEKHDHVDFILGNNKILRYTDPRRFGCILWTTEDPIQHRLLVNLGPEPLHKEFNYKYLLSKLINKSISIKQYIMDAKLVVGVGNIYASEALFKSKIHPLRFAKTITVEESKLLTKNIKQILKKSIAKGGTTLKDFFHSDGKQPGYFSQELTVYGRSGEPCLNCNNIITKIIIGQRSTFYCDSCQI